jgi:hypothetical protein
MSQEFDDVTHAFAELLSKLQSANDNDKQAAITFAIDTLLMAVGSIEHRLDALRPVEIHREFITAAARWMMAAKL